MAVELCKVSLWMEAMQPGKPLGFLDHRVIRGNALIGATPALLDAGVPDEAFKPLTGDDKTVVTSLRKRNKAARSGQSSLFGSEAGEVVHKLAAKAELVDAIGDDSIVAVQAKATRWSELITSEEYQAAVHAADTWCAAFVAPKRAGAPEITHAQYQTARSRPDRVDPAVREAVAEMTDQYGFLHWHLAFLDVYGGRGGFDVVLGNPPWEKVKLSEKEFFANRALEIAEMAGARRKAAIQKLQVNDPALFRAYENALRQAEGESHFIRSSGRFPLCGRGDVNTYAVFAEVMRAAVAPAGRLGVIVPTGIATDDTTKLFFGDCVTDRRLASLYDFENAERLFSGIATINRFCLLTLTGLRRPVDEAAFLFFAQRTADLADPARRFTLSPDDLALINPNTKTAPVFRSRRDAEITKAIYRRVPVLVRDDDPNGNPWGIEYQRMFDMTNDSHLFHTADDLRTEGATLTGNVWARDNQRWLPLYEAKMAHHFNHRDGDFAGYQLMAGKEVRTLAGGTEDQLRDPTYVVQARYWVNESEVNARLRDPKTGWLLGFRNITNTTTNRRTLISMTLPIAAVGHSTPLLRVAQKPESMGSLLASFVVDYVVRQKLGGTNMTFFIVNQLPVPQPTEFDLSAPWSLSETVECWIRPRLLELVYTAWDLKAFAGDLGWTGPPLVWNSARRELLRAELDAAYFHLYAIDRDDVDYIMDTFPIVSRKDEAAHGDYRTKRLILERYDALAECIANGTEYQTVLDPPPAHPSLAHAESTRPEWA